MSDMTGRKLRSLARRRKLWREFYFTGDGDLRLDSVWQSVRRAPDFHGCRMYRSGDGIVTTNIPMYLLQKMARMDDLHLPDSVSMAEDDPVIQELLHS